MLIIKVNNKSIDSALKAFKFKFNKTGVKDELMKRREFTKKSTTQREIKKKAIYIQTKKKIIK